MFFLSLFLNSCNGSTDKGEDVLENAQIGVIEASGNAKTSGIVFYDSDLTKTKSLKLKYATVGDELCNPVVYEGKLYVIPQGDDIKKDEEKVLEINLSNLKKKIYKIKQIGMYGLSVDAENIYTCSNLNGYSYIGKCNKKTGEVKEQKIENICMTQVLAYKNKLYAFGTKIYSNKTAENRKHMSYMYIYDSDFKLVHQVNLSKYGDSPDKVIAFENKIYFSNTYNSETELENNTICVYSIRDKKIEMISLKQDYPLDLDIYKDVLIVSQFDILHGKTGGISFVNLKTEEQKDYKLAHGVAHMVRKDDYIYILSDTEISSKTKLYKYQINGMDLDLVKEAKIDAMHSDNYLTGLFVVKK